MANVRPCPSCGQILDLSGFAPGDQVSCPNCGLSIAIASASATVSVAGTRKRKGRDDRRSAPITAIAALSAAMVVVLVIFGIAAEWGEEPATTASPAVPAPPPVVERVAPAPPRAVRRNAVQVARADEPPVASQSDDTDLSDSALPAGQATPSTTTDSPPTSINENSDAPAPATDVPAPASPSPASIPPTSTSPTSTSPTSAAPTGDAKPMATGGVPTEYSTTAPAEQEKPKNTGSADKDEKPLSPAEQKRLGYMTQVRKLVNRHFVAERRSTDLARGKPEDFFVVAKYEMPLSTRVADVRFEITDSLDKSVNEVVDYLASAPAGSARDFQVVARYASMSEATEGIVRVRQQYDQAKEYQAQLLAYLQTQQRIQATSTRRC